VLPLMIGWRRHFHRYPELSGHELKTQQAIWDELAALGLEPRKLAATGVVADLPGCGQGKMIALRADIDALPIQDELATDYRSQHAGVCHACGHDGHMAILLGIARALSQVRDSFSGTVRFIFQPSEEDLPGGALPMIAEGVLDGVDAIIGLHLWQSLAFGQIGVQAGAVMAEPDNFTLTVYGKGGHASLPHQTCDALLAGAQIALSLQAAVRQAVDPVEPALLSLGAFQSGSAFNIIPETAELRGTVRSFSAVTRERIFDQIERVAEGVCSAAGTHFILDRQYGCPPVVNEAALAAVVRRAAVAMYGDERVQSMPPLLGGEDFSYYQQQVPGVFFFVGSGGSAEGFHYPQHHAKFDINEQALAVGAAVMLQAALDFLHE